ncbi:hypothetical protein GWI34_29525 [Actinomadura sp. DSM 109109]|nr:hypothetical protein [Actinomadura lepetitiana]
MDIHNYDLVVGDGEVLNREVVTEHVLVQRGGVLTAKSVTGAVTVTHGGIARIDRVVSEATGTDDLGGYVFVRGGIANVGEVTSRGFVAAVDVYAGSATVSKVYGNGEVTVSGGTAIVEEVLRRRGEFPGSVRNREGHGVLTVNRLSGKHYAEGGSTFLGNVFDGATILASSGSLTAIGTLNGDVTISGDRSTIVSARR